MQETKFQRVSKLETIQKTYELLLKIHAPEVWQKLYNTPEAKKKANKEERSKSEFYNYNSKPG